MRPAWIPQHLTPEALQPEAPVAKATQGKPGICFKLLPESAENTGSNMPGVARAAGFPDLAVKLYDLLKHRHVLLLFVSHTFPIRKQSTAIRGSSCISGFYISAW